MSPRLTSNNRADSLFCHVVLVGERLQCDGIFGSSLTNDPDDFIGKLDVCASFPVSMSSLLDHVSGIVKSISEKQMVGVAARPIVACMENEEASRNRSPGESPCNAMRPMLATISGLEEAVPIAVGAGYPVPAFVCFTLVNFRPESVGGRLQGGILIRHRDISPVLPRTLAGDPGLSALRLYQTTSTA